MHDAIGLVDDGARRRETLERLAVDVAFVLRSVAAWVVRAGSGSRPKAGGPNRERQPRIGRRRLR